MTNAEAWQSYVGYTEDLTKHARFLGFSGVGIYWVLGGEQLATSGFLLPSLGLFLAFFLLDLLQYFLGALRRKSWIERRETELLKETKRLEGDYLPPKDLDKPVFFLFVGKVLVLILAFSVVGVEVLTRIL